MKKRLLHIFAALLLLTGLPMATPRVRAATYTVTNTNDSGPGSLRQAIIDANNTPGQDTIAFNIPKTDPGYSASDGVWTITLSSLLPTLTGGNTIIDGATQTANQGDANPAGPEVHIDGQNIGTDGWIFAMASDWNEILGLVLTGADQCAVQILPGTVGNRVKDSYIGVGPDGSSDAGNGTGVAIVEASESIIAHNVISWNDLYGIAILGSGADDNMIRRNTIGLDAPGTAKAPNGSHGVYITGGAQSNEVGGDPGYRNTISGNGKHGVYISGADTNLVSYNYIGIDATGTGSHDVGNDGSGVAIDSGAGSSYMCDNVISGNSEHGVWISGSGTHHIGVYGNIIGADAQVTALVPNGMHGVGIYNGAHNNWVGGNLEERNVIVGNGWSGVVVVNAGSSAVIKGNAIGTNKSGTATNLGNTSYGIHVVDGGGTLWFNHIAYNGAQTARAGVRVEGASATGIPISENSIHDNGGKGIELVSGGNGELSAPTITQASCQQVQGSTCAGCHVEIFSDDADEGRVYEGYTTAHAASGAFSWSGQLQGPNVTATVSDYSHDNTSEFSAPVTVVWFPLLVRD
jgi:hypothetical protein